MSRDSESRTPSFFLIPFHLEKMAASLMSLPDQILHLIAENLYMEHVHAELREEWRDFVEGMVIVPRNQGYLVPPALSSRTICNGLTMKTLTDPAHDDLSAPVAHYQAIDHLSSANFA